MSFHSEYIKVGNERYFFNMKTTPTKKQQNKQQEQWKAGVTEEALSQRFDSPLHWVSGQGD